MQIASWVWFILGGIFVDSFVINFVVCVVLIALDFWTVRPGQVRFREATLHGAGRKGQGAAGPCVPPQHLGEACT